MAGLREKQKADRERRILNAAVRDFRTRGYKAVRIEDLAVTAEVSVGTVYNYYRTKGDILMAIVALEVEEVLEAGGALIAAPPKDVEAAVLALIFTYYDHSLHYLSKEMWRHAMALSIQAPETPNGRRYTDLDDRLRRQVSDMIDRLQRNGAVRAGLDSAALGGLVFSELNQMFVEFTKDDAMTLEILKAKVTAHIRPLAQLIGGAPA